MITATSQDCFKEDKKMAMLIDGKKISQEIKDELKEKTAALKEKGIEVTLAVILVGEDPASQVYVRNKRKACEDVGIKSFAYDLPEATTQEELNALIEELNNNPEVDGILVQFPLPAHLDESKIDIIEIGFLSLEDKSPNQTLYRDFDKIRKS